VLPKNNLLAPYEPLTMSLTIGIICLHLCCRRETILVTLNSKGGRELAYQPGDHVAFFPSNSNKIVDGVLKKIKNLPPKDQLVIVEMLQKGTSARMFMNLAQKLDSPLSYADTHTKPILSKNFFVKEK